MIGLTLEQMNLGSLASRRGFLRATFGSALGLGAFHPFAQSADGSDSKSSEKAVIQIWLGGGPSHLDLYDLKPNAPADIRGPFQSIATNQPGVDVCELLPKHADIMQSLSLIRSLHHSSNDHVAGTHWMQTGYFGATSPQPGPTNPSIGSVVAHSQTESQKSDLPYVHILPELPIDLYSRQFNSAYLDPAFNPFEIKMPFPGYNPAAQFDAQDFSLVPGLNHERLKARLSLREQLDQSTHAIEKGDFVAGDYQRALNLVSSQRIRRAFDLSLEKPTTRERYGNTGWGQGALLCRRLVEAGATFVTLNTDSSSNMWDNHAGVEKYFRIMLPAYDAMLSALIEDLQQSGLYERVIVLVWGEFGRTPRINKRAGRDHWGNAGCALVGGGGLRVGQTIGTTTAKGDQPATRPISPADVLATLYGQLGIDTTRQFVNHAGRPIPILSDGQPIEELLA